jgi:nitrile hydratase beta subunit
MGGMDGFGPVVPESNEPVFHADWERRMFVITNLAINKAGLNVDEFRHGIERIPPGRYLASSYYERWLAAVETLLVEHGIVPREELHAIDPDAIANPLPAIAPPMAAVRKTAPRARFKPGDRVRARAINPAGHTRLPRYVRSKSGVVRRDWGVFVFPDTNAHNAGTKPQHCYNVVFAGRELWGKSPRASHRVHLDLWEDYLDSADDTHKPQRNKR